MGFEGATECRPTLQSARPTRTIHPVPSSLTTTYWSHPAWRPTMPTLTDDRLRSGHSHRLQWCVNAVRAWPVVLHAAGSGPCMSRNPGENTDVGSKTISLEAVIARKWLMNIYPRIHRPHHVGGWIHCLRGRRIWQLRQQARQRRWAFQYHGKG